MSQYILTMTKDMAYYLDVSTCTEVSQAFDAPWNIISNSSGWLLLVAVIIAVSPHMQSWFSDTGQFAPKLTSQHMDNVVVRTEQLQTNKCILTAIVFLS